MLIIRIEPFDNGAHDNQEYHGVLPEGWAFLSQEVGTAETLENFPFGDIVVEDVTEEISTGAVSEDGGEIMKTVTRPYVTAWTPGVMPELEMEPLEEEPTVWDELDAAYQEGVDSV